MSIIIEGTWPLPEVNTVFDLDFFLHADEAAEWHQASVTCRGPPRETREVKLRAVCSTPLHLRFQSGHVLRGTMEVVRSGERGASSIGIFARLEYGRAGETRMQIFEGCMLLRAIEPGPCPGPTPPDPDPDPIEPWPSDEPDGGESVITPYPDELFPYIQIRNWPNVPDEDLEFGFFHYVASSPPSSPFIADLGEAARRGRSAMEQTACDFIDGASPYQGQFIASRAALPLPVRAFARLAASLQGSDPTGREWLEELRRRVIRLLEKSSKESAYLLGADYREILDRVWQSYVALAVTLGYDQALLIDFARTLCLANAISKALVPGPVGDEIGIRKLSREQRGLLARASLVLPKDIFPPRAGGGADSPPGDGGWVEPYAVGDLQMVRRGPVRYERGEIARIENVMRGERREVSTRQRHRQLDLQETRGDKGELLETADADERAFLLEEISRAVAGKSLADAFTDFDTTYGPPTQVKLGGTRTRTTTALTPASDDTTRFARDILSKTVNRISRKVGTVRSSSVLSQSEEAVVSVVDNRSGKRNLCAVYRWVNKVYHARVFNYGNRLIIEFMVPRPAAEFIARSGRHHHLHRPEPPVPSLTSFEGVSEADYAQWCGAYEVTDISPPPEKQKWVTAVLRAGEQAQVAIPAGYRAHSARAASVSAPAGARPSILVGNSLLAPDATILVDPYGEDATLPVAVADAAVTLSPPVFQDMLVTVEILCERTDRRFAQWQIEIYSALLRAHQLRVERHRAAAATAERLGPALPPLARRDIERFELRRGCERILLDSAVAQTGGTLARRSPPEPSSFDRQRVEQFLDRSIEWGEMSFRFDGPHLLGRERGRCGEDDEDPAFERFLEAAYARVLVPVQPDRVFAFLAFLSTGAIWSGPDWLVGINHGDRDVVDDLKRAALHDRPERPVGDGWKIVVPTAMQILDGLGRDPFCLAEESR